MNENHHSLLRAYIFKLVPSCPHQLLDIVHTTTRRQLAIFLERDDRRGNSSKGLSCSVSFVRVSSSEAPTGQADLAIGSLTISYEREQRVSFTTPFMNTGVSILYKTAQPSDPGACCLLLN